jgi:hypothetical protein
MTSRFGGLAAVFLTLMLGACKSTDDGSEIPPTSSGMPEVVLPAKPLDELMDVARDFFVKRGYVEKESRHAYELLFDKQAKPGESKRALRVALRFDKLPKGTWRLTGVPMGVDDWRAELETARVVPQGKAQIQAFLYEIKTRAEASR